jgi:hypothetical protein
MPLPMSKTALDKLGKRMAASSQIADADLDQFALVAGACHTSCPTKGGREPRWQVALHHGDRLTGLHGRTPSGEVGTSAASHKARSTVWTCPVLEIKDLPRSGGPAVRQHESSRRTGSYSALDPAQTTTDQSPSSARS